MPTVNEQILDELTGHSVDLMRVDAYMRERVITELRKLQRELTSKLEQADLPGYTRTSYQRKRTRELLKQTEETISNYYRQIAAIHAGMLDDVAGIAEVQVVSAINAGVSASVASVAMSESQLVAIAKNTLIQGAPSAEWWGRQGAYLQMQFEDKVRSGLMQGLTTGQIVQSIRGTRANQYRDGIMQASKRSAENLVRTSVQAVANEARMQTYDDNDDIIKAIEWVSTLDSRTSDICRALDGLTWKPGTMKPIGHNKKFPGPTAHWNCRSNQTPVLKSWDELGIRTKKAKAIPESTRASMDGQVPESLKYEDWLKTKPKEFQVKVLGPGKYELWKSGKLGFRDMVDQSGNALPLEVLKAKLRG